MEELYKAIEEKIKSCGYPRAISGEAVYEDICDQIDGKEMVPMFYCQNLRMTRFLSITSL